MRAQPSPSSYRWAIPLGAEPLGKGGVVSAQETGCANTTLPLPRRFSTWAQRDQQHFEHGVGTMNDLREDLLRQLGYGIVRLVWSDLAVPARVQAKMLAEITILRQRGLW